jgi:hypothetical protein
MDPLEEQFLEGGEEPPPYEDRFIVGRNGENLLEGLEWSDEPTVGKTAEELYEGLTWSEQPVPIPPTEDPAKQQKRDKILFEQSRKPAEAVSTPGRDIAKKAFGRFNAARSGQELQPDPDAGTPDDLLIESMMANIRTNVPTHVPTPEPWDPEMQITPAEFGKAIFDDTVVAATKGSTKGGAGGIVVPASIILEALGRLPKNIRNNALTMFHNTLAAEAPEAYNKWQEEMKKKGPAQSLTEAGPEPWLAEIGKTSKEYYSGWLEQLEQVDPTGDITKNPWLLTDPGWWFESVSQTATTMGGAITFGGGTATGAAVAGALMEATPMYDTLRETGDESALAKAAVFGVMVAGLEKVGFDRIFAGASGSALQKTVMGVVNGLVEGGTEWAEEPVGAMIENLGKEGITLTEYGQRVLEAAKQGLNVLPASILVGGSTVMVSAKQAAQVAQEQGVDLETTPVIPELAEEPTEAPAEAAEAPPAAAVPAEAPKPVPGVPGEAKITPAAPPGDAVEAERPVPAPIPTPEEAPGAAQTPYERVVRPEGYRADLPKREIQEDFKAWRESIIQEGDTREGTEQAHAFAEEFKGNKPAIAEMLQRAMEHNALSAQKGQNLETMNEAIDLAQNYGQLWREAAAWAMGEKGLPSTLEEQSAILQELEEAIRAETEEAEIPAAPPEVPGEREEERAVPPGPPPTEPARPRRPQPGAPKSNVLKQLAEEFGGITRYKEVAGVERLAGERKAAWQSNRGAFMKYLRGYGKGGGTMDQFIQWAKGQPGGAAALEGLGEGDVVDLLTRKEVPAAPAVAEEAFPVPTPEDVLAEVKAGKAERVIPVNLEEGSLVWKDGQWYRVTQAGEGTTFKDGVPFTVAGFESTDATAVVTPDEAELYAAAEKEFLAQEELVRPPTRAEAEAEMLDTEAAAEKEIKRYERSDITEPEVVDPGTQMATENDLEVKMRKTISIESERRQKAGFLRLRKEDPKPTKGTFEFEDKNVEQIHQQSHGLPPRSWVSGVYEGMKNIGKSMVRTHQHMPRSSFFADAHNSLRKILALPEYVNRKVQKTYLRYVTSDMETAEDLDLFERYTLLSDLRRDIELGRTLPNEWTPESVVSELDRLDAAIDERSDAEGANKIRDALGRRREMHASIQEQLVKAGILSKGQVDANPDYFHHQVLDFASSRVFFTGKRVKPTKGGYSKARKGTLRAINTSYLEAEGEYLTQALRDIETHEYFEEIAKNYDRMKEARELQKTMSEEQGRDVDLNEAIAELEFDPKTTEGLATFQPTPGNVFYTAMSVPERILKEALENNPELPLEIDPEHLKEVLAKGGKRRTLLLPQELAKTLDEFRPNVPTLASDKAVRAIMKGWKGWVLISPRRFIKYNLNNFSGDLDGIFFANPEAVKYIPAAVKELISDFVGRGAMSKDLEAALKDGVVGGGWAAAELREIRELPQFQRLQESIGTKNPAALYWELARGLTQLREDVLRLASYKARNAQMDRGENPHGVSKWETIEGLSTQASRAAQLARDDVLDYSDVSAFGNWFRAKAYPFWAFQELNFRRYINGFRNAIKEGRAAKQAAKTPFLAFSGILRNTILKPLRAIAFMGLVRLANYMLHREEEEELSDEERQQMHLILGRDQYDDVVTLRTQGSLDDFIGWFGGHAIVPSVKRVMDDRGTWMDVLRAVRNEPVNKLAQGIGGPFRTIVELGTGQEYYPDIFSPREIHDNLRHVAKGLNLEHEYDILSGQFGADRPLRGDGNRWQRYMQTWKRAWSYTYNADEAAYWRLQDSKRSFLKDNYDPKTKQTALYRFKMALRFQDQEALAESVQELTLLMKIGELTTKNIQQSIESMEPLSGMSRAKRTEFIEQLQPKERDWLEGAQRFYKLHLGPEAYSDLLPPDIQPAVRIAKARGETREKSSQLAAERAEGKVQQRTALSKFRIETLPMDQVIKFYSGLAPTDKKRSRGAFRERWYAWVKTAPRSEIDELTPQFKALVEK